MECRPTRSPLGTILPKATQCDNLLVPLAVSSSHIAFGSIRMEPVFMILGQSAGTLAGLALAAETTIQHISYDTLAQRLKADNQILSYR